MNSINKSTLPVNNINESTSYSIGNEVDSILSLGDYENNENVILCKKLLNELLFSGKNTEQIMKNADNILMNFLTFRPEYSKLLLNNNPETVLLSLKENYKIQNEWYKSVIMALGKYFDKNDKFYSDSNPAWFSIKQNKEKSDSLNFKLYKTIFVKNYSFIQFLPDLSLKLYDLGNNTNDNISIKVPTNLLGFLTHSDSLVIHFKNLDNKEIIENILDEWTMKHGIVEESRNLGRTKFAADSKKSEKSEKTSFSQIVSKIISKWLADNYGKYNNQKLVDLAVKYAIQSAQRIPKVNGKDVG